MPHINKRQLVELKRIARYLTMETAAFGSIGSYVQECDRDGNAFGPVRPTTDFIRETTANWRRTWVTGPLDAIIADLEKKG